MQMAQRPSSGEILQVAELFRKGCESLRRKAAEKQREVLGLFFLFFFCPESRPEVSLSRLPSKLCSDPALSLGWGDAASPPARPASVPTAALPLTPLPT